MKLRKPKRPLTSSRATNSLAISIVKKIKKGQVSNVKKRKQQLKVTKVTKCAQNLPKMKLIRLPKSARIRKENGKGMKKNTKKGKSIKGKDIKKGKRKLSTLAVTMGKKKSRAKSYKGKQQAQNFKVGENQSVVVKETSQ